MCLCYKRCTVFIHFISTLVIVLAVHAILLLRSTVCDIAATIYIAQEISDP